MRSKELPPELRDRVVSTQTKLVLLRDVTKNPLITLAEPQKEFQKVRFGSSTYRNFQTVENEIFWSDESKIELYA